MQLADGIIFEYDIEAIVQLGLRLAKMNEANSAGSLAGPVVCQSYQSSTVRIQPATHLNWWLLFAGIILIGLFLRVHHLAADCFDEDELYAVYITGISPKTIATVVARDGLHTNHPCLMTVPFLFWTYFVGISEAEVRLISVISSLLSIVLTYRFTARLGGYTAGLAAVVFLSLNPLHIAYAREARHYAILVALVAASHLAFLNSLLRGRRLDHLIYFLLAILTAMTHYFGAVVLVGHIMAVVWGIMFGDSVTRRSAARSLLSIGLAAIVCSPWLVVTKYQLDQPWRHLSHISAETLYIALLEATGTYGNWDRGNITAMVLAGITAYGLWCSRRIVLSIRSDGSPGPFPRLAGLIAIVFGLAGVVAAWKAVPAKVIPAAHEVLKKYEYTQSQIDAELQVINLTCILLPLALAFAGSIVLLWTKWDRGESDHAATKSEASLSASIYLGCLIFAPIVLIGLLSLLKVPILQTRNLIVLLPAIAAGVGMGVAALGRTFSGRMLLIPVIILFVVTGARYRHVAMPFGGDGFELGSVTPNWRAPKAWLNRQDVPKRLIVIGKSPMSDPVTWYMKNNDYIRLQPDKVWMKLPDQFHFLFIANDRTSITVQDRLLADGYGLTIEWQNDEFTIMSANKPPR